MLLVFFFWPVMLLDAINTSQNFEIFEWIAVVAAAAAAFNFFSWLYSWLVSINGSPAELQTKHLSSIWTLPCFVFEYVLVSFQIKIQTPTTKKKKRSHPHTITQMLVGSDKPSSFLCCCCCLVLLSIRKSFTLSAWLAWGASSWEADVTATGLGLMSIYNERSGHANEWMLVLLAFFSPCCTCKWIKKRGN